MVCCTYFNIKKQFKSLDYWCEFWNIG